MDDFKDPKDALNFLSYLYEQRKLGERTINLYKFYYSKFNPKIDEEYISDFIIENKNTTAVRGMVLNWLKMRGIEMKLPPRSISKPKKVIRRISLEDINKISNYLYSKSFKDGLIFDLIYQGALRRVEIITLKVSSFRWKEWLNDVTKMCKLVVLGKGNKERIVLINSETAEKIFNKLIPKFVNLEQVDRLTNSVDYLFSKNDIPLTEKQIYDIIRNGSEKAINVKIRPHELRHNRATELQNKGVQIHDIKNYLGHSRISTTEIYLHKSGEESLKSIEEIIK